MAGEHSRRGREVDLKKEGSCDGVGLFVGYVGMYVM